MKSKIAVDGMGIKALVARTNVVLPPPSGPARVQHCLKEGISELLAARIALWQGESLLKRALSFPGCYGLLADGRALLAGPTGAFVQNAGSPRVQEWFILRAQAFGYFKEEFLGTNGRPYIDFVAAGQIVHEALLASGRGYLWLMDAAIDVAPETRVQLGSQEPYLLDLLWEVHALLHRSGEIYGGLYGCKLNHEQGRWYQQCQVHLPHVPLANSIGFTCRYLCSVCGEDASTCRHVRGQNYDLVVAKNPNGMCRVCQPTQKRCEHANGQTLSIQANVMIADIELREISLVGRARDPLARITAIEKPLSELISRLGRTPDPRDTVLCHTCMVPCQRKSA